VEKEREVFRPRWLWFVEWTSDAEAVYRAAEKVLAYEKTPYQEVAVFDSIELGKVLVIDGKVQSSLFDEYVYHESLVHPAMITHGSPRKALILGGGEGATLREVLRYSSIEKAVMVDIDKSVVEFSKKHLIEWHKGAFDDPRARVVIEDGRKYLENTVKEGEKFDVIILDLVDPLEGGPALKLYTREFYTLVYNALSKEGIMVTQATSHAFYPKVFATIYRTISDVFDITRAYTICVRSFNGPWGFVIGSKKWDPKALTIEEVEKRINNLVSATGELRFYDGETHHRLFSLSRDIRKLLAEHATIATDQNMVYINF
jgi:spermidine synthase